MKILKASDLPTEYVDKLPFASKAKEKIHFSNIDFTKVDENDPICFVFSMRHNINHAKGELRLTNWLAKNYKIALEKLESNKPLQKEVDRLRMEISRQWKLTEIRWECGWNVTHFRGCLQSLLSLSEHHPDVMIHLKNRVLVFAPFTGISLDGHIMLNSGEVRHNWLDVSSIESNSKL